MDKEQLDKDRKQLLVSFKFLRISKIKQKNIYIKRCPKCNGKGKTVTKECHVCHGNKIVKGLDELTLYIEKGMKNGSEIVNKYISI